MWKVNCHLMYKLFIFLILVLTLLLMIDASTRQQFYSEKCRVQGLSAPLHAASQWDSLTLVDQGMRTRLAKPSHQRDKYDPSLIAGPVNCHNGNRKDKRRHKADDAADGGDTNIETPVD